MEKDIKKQKIEIEKLTTGLIDEPLTIEVTESTDYEITAKVSGMQFKRKIIFLFKSDGIHSDISIKLALDNKSDIDIEAVVVIPDVFRECASTLSLRALLLDQYSKISFTPSLEINNISASADHHSTIGVPNKGQIEYLQSRGLTEAECIGLIADSFLV